MLLATYFMNISIIKKKTFVCFLSISFMCNICFSLPCLEDNNNNNNNVTEICYYDHYDCNCTIPL